MPHQYLAKSRQTETFWLLFQTGIFKIPPSALHWTHNNVDLAVNEYISTLWENEKKTLEWYGIKTVWIHCAWLDVYGQVEDRSVIADEETGSRMLFFRYSPDRKGLLPEHELRIGLKYVRTASEHGFLAAIVYSPKHHLRRRQVYLADCD